MVPSERLLGIARQLEVNEPVQPVTVREFLSWFDAQRRGYWIVQEIRTALNAHGLRTVPDFESEYIDSPISLVLAKENVEAFAGTGGMSVVAPMPIVTATGGPSQPILPQYADPTHRIRKLAVANREPLSVAPDASLAEAATKMLTHGFSQLPVMNGREIKGVVSWSSIGSRFALGQGSDRVRELMDPPQEIGIGASIFQAIPIIALHEYVLVRGADNKISGIVTASDLSFQFQQLAEPFLLLSEIENHIRRLLNSKFSPPELSEARDPGAGDRTVNSVSDLTFGEYLRLLENPDRWNKLDIRIDRKTFCGQLDRIREIRNDVMHFDPDGVSPEDLGTLREFAGFFQKLRSIGAS